MNRILAAKKRSGKKPISKRKPVKASAKGGVPTKRREGEMARKDPKYKTAYVKKGQAKRKSMTPNNPRY